MVLGYERNSRLRFYATHHFFIFHFSSDTVQQFDRDEKIS